MPGFDAISDAGSALGSLGSGLGSLFGGTTKGSSRGTGSETRTATSSDQLQLDPEAIQKIIQDVLGGADGLASIFSGEKTSGLYNSTAAAQAAGDLSTRLIGELAKLTGKQVKEESGTVDTSFESSTKNKEGGALGGVVDSIKGVLGGLF